jgi:hypothetical protein
MLDGLRARRFATSSAVRIGSSNMAESDLSAIEAIIALAEEIGRASPESADKAMQIVDLARGLTARPDRNTIQDALEAGAHEGSLSDVSARRTADDVARALSEE